MSIIESRKPLCNAHRDRDSATRTLGYPTACPTCHRLSIEQDLVIRTVDVLIAAGYALTVSSGLSGHPAKHQPYTKDRATVLSYLMDCDEDWLMANRTDAQPVLCDGWVRFVYGNGGYDAISDYTVNLETVLAPVNAYAATLA